MKTTPIGKMNSVKAFMAPVVVAASGVSPRWATISASDSPTTTWDARDTTMGHASTSSDLRPGQAPGPEEIGEAMEREAQNVTQSERGGHDHDHDRDPADRSTTTTTTITTTAQAIGRHDHHHDGEL